MLQSGLQDFVTVLVLIFTQMSDSIQHYLKISKWLGIKELVTVLTAEKMQLEHLTISVNCIRFFGFGENLE